MLELPFELAIIEVNSLTTRGGDVNSSDISICLSDHIG